MFLAVGDFNFNFFSWKDSLLLDKLAHKSFISKDNVPYFSKFKSFFGFTDTHTYYEHKGPDSKCVSSREKIP